MSETFNPITTQEEFDAAIKTRLERERNKYADYPLTDTTSKRYRYQAVYEIYHY